MCLSSELLQKAMQKKEQIDVLLSKKTKVKPVNSICN